MEIRVHQDMRKFAGSFITLTKKMVFIILEHVSLRQQVNELLILSY